jgi:uncharacterized coiled-coil protein SlyX
MSKFLLYGKIALFIVSATIIGLMAWQNYILQNRLNTAMEQIGNLSGAIDTQSITIDQLNRQVVVTQRNMQRVQTETVQIEINTIEEQRTNRAAVNSAYTEPPARSSEIITNRTNELFRNLRGVQ